MELIFFFILYYTKLSSFNFIFHSGFYVFGCLIFVIFLVPLCPIWNMPFFVDLLAHFGVEMSACELFR